MLINLHVIFPLGNGTVDFHEFLRMMSRSRSRTKSDDIRKKVEEEEMRQAFKVQTQLLFILSTQYQESRGPYGSNDSATKPVTYGHSFGRPADL